ncbi:MAG: protein-methionine-sulfoxide reductase heme-binding subunit MsrQ, partial [Steroidobacteraceae bacterium]
MNIGQQFRFIYKPLVFAACATPVVLMALGIAAQLGVVKFAPMDLGVDPVKRLIHACGITALNILLITLAVTPLRQITHWNHLLRVRRMLGLFAFFYAVLHFTCYAWLDQGLDIKAIGADIVKRPYITIGMAALLLLIPLAVTSTN